jgi:hypothetical protein
MTESIEEQRKVEGFGDPQYTALDLELNIRVAIYTFLQQQKAAGNLTELKLTQDWEGNTIQLSGKFRPMLMAKWIMEKTQTAA